MDNNEFIIESHTNNSDLTGGDNTLDLTDTASYTAPTQEDMLRTPSRVVKANTLELGRFVNSGLFDELGYNPYRDNEDAYYQGLSAPKQLLNSSIQLFGQASQAFGAGFNKSEQIKNLFGQTNDDYLKDQFEFSNLLRDKYPVFKSAEESAGFLGYVPGFGAFSKWTNFIPNVGFTIGTMGQVLVEQTVSTAIIELMTGGVGTPIAVAKWAQGLHKAFRGISNFNKTRKLLGTGATLAKGAKAGLDIYTDGVKAFGAAGGLLRGYEALKGGKVAYGTLHSLYGGYQVISSATGEAIIENAHTVGESIALMKEEYRDTYGQEPSDDDIEEMRGIAEDTVLPTTMGNVAVLSLSNALQEFNALKLGKAFSASLGGSLNQLTKGAVGNITIDASTGLARKLGVAEMRKQALKGTARGFLDASMEGVEELSQGVISTASKEWALANYNKDSSLWVDHLGEGIRQAFSEEGYEEFSAGVVTGALFSGGGRLKAHLEKRKELKTSEITQDKLTDSIVKEMNESLSNLMQFHLSTGESVKNLNTQTLYQEVIAEADSKGQTMKAQQYRDLALVKAIFTAKTYGKDEAYIEHLEGLKELSKEELQNYLSAENASEVPSQEQLQESIDKAKKIQKLADRTMNLFGNPYKKTNPLDPKYRNLPLAEDILSGKKIEPFKEKEFIKERSMFEAWQGAQEMLVTHSLMHEEHVKKYNDFSSKIAGTGVDIDLLAAVSGDIKVGNKKEHIAAKKRYLSALDMQIKTLKESIKSNKESSSKDIYLEFAYDRELKHLEEEYKILKDKRTAPETKLDKIQTLRKETKHDKNIQSSFDISKESLRSAGDILAMYDDFNNLYTDITTSENVIKTLSNPSGFNRASKDMFHSIHAGRKVLFENLKKDKAKAQAKPDPKTRPQADPKAQAQPDDSNPIPTTPDPSSPEGFFGGKTGAGATAADSADPADNAGKSFTDRLQVKSGAVAKKTPDPVKDDVKVDDSQVPAQQLDAIDEVVDSLNSEFKKTSGTNVAYNSIFYTFSEEAGILVDKLDDGELKFVEESDTTSSQRVNSNKIKLGDTVTIKIDFDSKFSDIKSLEDLNAAVQSRGIDNVLDKLHFKIFHEVSPNKEIGSLNKLSSINASTVEEDRVEMAKEELSNMKKAIIEATLEDKESTTEIDGITRGYLNRANNYKTVDQVFPEGTLYGVVTDNNKVTLLDGRVRTFNFLENSPNNLKGLPVAMVEQNGVLHPILLRKNPVSDNPALFDGLVKAVINWINLTNQASQLSISKEERAGLTEKKNTVMDIINDIIYIDYFKDKDDLLSTISMNGISMGILELPGKAHKLYIGKTPLEYDGSLTDQEKVEQTNAIRDALSKLLFNVNLKSTHSKYEELIHTGGILSTRARFNPLLEGERSYFSQRSISLKPISTTETPKAKTKKVKASIKKAAATPSTQSSEVDSKLNKPFKTFKDGSGKMVTVTTETTEKDGIKKTKFKTETKNRKGEPKNQNDKGYNTFEEAVENLDIDLQSKENEPSIELVETLKKSRGKETLPARVLEIRESTDKSSPFFGLKTATVVVGGQKIEFELKTQPTQTTSASNNLSEAQEIALRKMRALYPNIKIGFTQDGKAFEVGDGKIIMNQEDSNQVAYSLKVVSALKSFLNPKDTKRTRKYGEKPGPSRKTIRLNTKERPYIETNVRKDLRGRGVTDAQVDFIFNYMKTKDIKKISVEDMITSLLADNSFVVEVNTAKEKVKNEGPNRARVKSFINNGFIYSKIGSYTETLKVVDDNYPGAKYDESYDLHYDPESGTEITNKEYEKNLIDSETDATPTQRYANLSARDKDNESIYRNNPDWEYQELAIQTPDVLNISTAHTNDFSEGVSNMLGWARVWYNKKTGEVHVQEVQSELFQKGRDKKDLAEEVEDIKDNFTYNGIEYIRETSYGGNSASWFYKIDNNTKEGYLAGKQEISFEEYRDTKKEAGFSDKSTPIKKNQFLQLLNKDGNWVKFFIQSIVQDSIKKGYKKVLFPTGETAARVEGHQTIADEIKRLDERIKYLEDNKTLMQDGSYVNEVTSFNFNGVIYDQGSTLTIANNDAILRDGDKEKSLSGAQVSEFFEETGITPVKINNKKEIAELEAKKAEMKSQGIEKLKPVEAFYTNRVTNILNKLYDVKEVTDEHGNTWNEVDLAQPKDAQEILLQQDEKGRIKGQANIDAMTVLFDKSIMSDDTIYHEYAHHYIAANRNAPIVQEAIKKWGSEENLVQAIGEQSLAQGGEALDWFTRFIKWLKNSINKLSDKSKEELKNILTDAFLNNETIQSDTPTQQTSEVEVPKLTTVKVNLSNLSESELKNVVKQLRQKEVAAKKAERQGKTVLGGSASITADKNAVKKYLSEKFKPTQQSGEVEGNVIGASFQNQGTDFMLEIQGNNKPFLLVWNRNNANPSLWGKKQKDGSYTTTDAFPSKQDVQKLVDKYVPKNLLNLLNEWTAASKLPVGEVLDAQEKIEKRIEAEINQPTPQTTAPKEVTKDSIKDRMAKAGMARFLKKNDKELDIAFEEVNHIKNYGDRSRVIPTMPFKMERDIMNSMIAYLVQADKTKDAKASEQVLDLMLDQITLLESFIEDKVYDELSEEEKADHDYISNILSSLGAATEEDNFTKLYDTATRDLNGLGKDGFVLSEQEYAGESMEDLQYDPDSESTRDFMKTMPSEVKVLLNYIPAHKFDGTDTVVEFNSIGLPKLANFRDLVDKLYTALADTYYSSNWNEGFLKMLEKVGSIEDANVQQVYKMLKNSENHVLRKHFFTTFNTTHINREVLTIDKLGKNIIVRILSIGRNSGFKKMISNIFSELKLNAHKEGMIGKYNSTTHEYHINKKVALEVTEELKEHLDTLKDIRLNLIKVKEKKNKTALYEKITEEAEAIAKILNKVGFSVSANSFDKYLRKRKLVNLKALNKYFFTPIEKAGNKESNTDLIARIFDTKEMKSLLRYEYNSRNTGGVSNVNENGKNFNTYERTNFLSDAFSKIKDLAYATKLVTVDVMASGSKFIQEALDQVAAISNVQEREAAYQEALAEQFSISYVHGNRAYNNEQKEFNKTNDYEYTIDQQHRFMNKGLETTKIIPLNFADKKKKVVIESKSLDNRGIPTALHYDAEGNIHFSDKFLELAQDNIMTEAKRVALIQEQNKSLPDHKKIEGTHTFYNKDGSVKKQGSGEFFISQPWMNAALLPKEYRDLIYTKDGTLNLTEMSKTESINFIREVTTQVFIDQIEEVKEDLRDSGFIAQNQKKPEKEYLSMVSSSGDFVTGFVNRVLNKTTIKDSKAFGGSARTRGEAASILFKHMNGTRFDKVINAYAASFVQNQYASSMEFTFVTGDPAQAGKFEPLKGGEDKANWVINSIDSTLKNFNKRLAGYLASRDRFIFDDPLYNVAYATDMGAWEKISTEVTAKGDESLTDAQELVTAKEALKVELAEGNISYADYLGGLYVLDREQYEMDRYNQDLTFVAALERANTSEASIIDKAKNSKGFYNQLVLQPAKPVQRFTEIDEELQASVHTYIKSSAYVITDAMAPKGSHLRALLQDMKANNVDRVSFISAVKQGIMGSQPLIKENEYNTDFLTNNIHTFDRAGYGKQLRVPYDETKFKNNMSTQMLTLLMSDIKDSDIISEGVTGAQIKEEYAQIINDMVSLRVDELNKELGVDSEGRITDLSALSELLIEEGKDRGYSMNTLFGLEMEDGKFQMPLAFLPNVSQIEPVLVSIINNRVVKSVMPGKSLVQGSEILMKMREGSNVGEVSSDIESNKDSIVFADKNYQPTELKPNEVVLPWLFKASLENFMDGDFLDMERIDPQLLEFIGFRIPFQSLNSGEKLKIVGFLPKVAGDLIIVSAELALKMGSDYDVDKLYSYMLNHELERTPEDQDQVDQWLSYRDQLREQMTTEEYKSYEQVSDYMSSKYLEYEEFQEKLSIIRNIRTVDREHKRAMEQINELNKSTLGAARLVRYKGDNATKILQNKMIDVNKAIYGSTNKEIQERIKASIDNSNVDNAIAITEGAPDSRRLPLNFSNIYQKRLHFSNSVGASALGMSANLNTLHAKAQGANLYAKSSVVFHKEDGTILSDNKIDYKNSVNVKKGENPYTYVDESGETVDRTELSEGAWRLDKIRTFSNNGKTYNISELISDLIGEAVDNAKNQKLGLLGINAHNFNAYSGMIQRGFDHVWASAFVKQPILKELYERLDSQSNSFGDNSIYLDINKIIRDLVKDIAAENDIKRYDEDGNSILKEEVITLDYLVNRATGVDKKEQPLKDISLLQKFATLHDTSIDLLTIIGNYNTLSKRLPKNLSETLVVSDNIDKIEGDQFRNISNASNLKDGATAIYNSIPKLALELFSSTKNPILPYTTPAYLATKKKAEAYLQRKLKVTDIDLVNREIKKYMYTHPDIIKQVLENETYSEAQDRLTSVGFMERILTAKSKLDNPFLNRLVTELERGRLTIDLDSPLNADKNERDYIVQGWTELFEEDYDLAKDLFAYTLLFKMDEYHGSGLVKNIPFGALKQFKIIDIISDEYAGSLGDGAYFDQFMEQFIQHYPKYSIFVNKTSKFFKGQENKDVIEIPYTYQQGERKNLGLRIYDEVESYKFNVPYDGDRSEPPFIYIPNKGKLNVYKKLSSVDLSGDHGYISYQKIDNLGTRDNGSEYKFGQDNTKSFFNSDGFEVKEEQEVLPVTGSDNLVAIANKSNEEVTKKTPLEKNKEPEVAVNNKNLSELQTFYHDMMLTKTPREVLATISTNLEEGMYKTLAGLLAKEGTMPDGVTLKPIVNIKGQNGEYTPSTKVVKVNIGKLTEESEIVRVILHEMLHAFSLEKLNVDSKYAQEVSKIWNEYKRNILFQEKSAAKIRLIPEATFEAVLFKAIVKMTKAEASNTGDYTPSSLLDKVSREGQDALVNLLKEMESIIKEESAFFKKDIKNGNLITYENGEFSERTLDLMEAIAQRLNPKDLNTMKNKYYGFIKLSEFVTMAATQPEMQASLKSMKTTGYETANKGLFKRLLDLIAKLFPGKRSLLNDAVEAVMDLAVEPIVGSSKTSDQFDGEFEADPVKEDNKKTKSSKVAFLPGKAFEVKGTIKGGPKVHDITFSASEDGLSEEFSTFVEFKNTLRRKDCK